MSTKETDGASSRSHGDGERAVPSGGFASMRVGRLTDASAPGALVVELQGSPAGPLRARSTLVLDAAAIARAVATGQGVVVLFENADPSQPVVIGLLDRTAGGELLGELLARPRVQTGEAPMAAPSSAAAPVEARLDGKRVVLEGREEVVLRCGDASITLKRDGKVIVRGRYVETEAQGVNRIKGGSVKIN